MKRVFWYVLIFAVVGLVAGYFYYGKIAGEYISPLKLIGPAKNELHKFGRAISGIESIRNNILMWGGIGAVLGIVINFLRKK